MKEHKKIAVIIIGCLLNVLVAESGLISSRIKRQGEFASSSPCNLKSNTSLSRIFFCISKFSKVVVLVICAVDTHQASVAVAENALQ